MPISRKEPGCIGCPLEFTGQGFLQPEGQGTLGVLILGEAAGEAEAASSLPFRPYAASGSILERAIKRCGYTREQFVVHNTVNCRPPSNKLDGCSYERASVRQCAQYLRRVMDRFRPRCILALGGVALRATTAYAGKDCGISNLRGFILDSAEFNCPVIPSFHPSFIRRGNAALLGVLMRDLKLAVQVAQTGRSLALEQRYNEVPTIAEAQAYFEFLAGRPDLPIAYDIETDYSHQDTDESEAVSSTGNKVTQIQFSHEPGQAIVFQWKGEYKEVARLVLGLPNRKLAQNGWLFDEIKLRDKQNGQVEVKGTTEDIMWMFHALQPDLPKRLQNITSFYDPAMPVWKHLAGSDMTFYGGSDVDSVQRVYPRLREQLEKEGLYDSYRTYVRGLYPCLRAMSDRGLPMDLAGRENFKEEVRGEQKEVWKVIQEHVTKLHPELSRVHPESGYVNEPKETEGLIQREFSTSIPIRTACPTCDGHGTIAGKRQGSSKGCPKCKRSGEVNSKTEFTTASVTRWCRLEGFNPDSPQQLFAYMAERRHPIPTDRTGKRTSDDDALQRLYKSTGDELYKRTLEYRKLGKVRETYLDGKGWTPAENGRIHSTFGFGPATWQLNSKDPNIQNIPKHGDVASRFRKLVAACPDHVLVEFDFSGFHALTLGFEAQDPTYMRLARLDPHSYLTGQFLKLEGADRWLELPWQELAEILERVKKDHKDVRDQKAKPAMHGYGFGMMGSKLHYLHPESFASREEAQHVIDLLDKAFPKIPAYREAVRAEAHKKGFLKTRYGAIRRFYDVYTWSSRDSEYRPGEQYNEVVAFRPSNNAFGKVRDVMLELEVDGSNERFELILNNHDSLLYHCPTALLDTCLEVVSTCMEKPSPKLVCPVVSTEGLCVGIEAMVGKTWGEMSCAYKTDLSRLMEVN